MSWACPLKMGEFQAVYSWGHQCILIQQVVCCSKWKRVFLLIQNFKKPTKVSSRNVRILCGHMRCVGILNNSDVWHEHFFLPHHGKLVALPPNSELFSINLFKLKKAIFLNDLLHTGPNLLPQLLDLICSRCNYEFVTSVDLEKYFDNF